MVSEGRQIRIFLSLFLIIVAGLLFWQGGKVGKDLGPLYDGQNRVNVNLADRETLAAAEYVDSQLADDSVRVREERGAFASDEDLMRVPGIDEYSLPVLKEVLFY